MAGTWEQLWPIVLALAEYKFSILNWPQTSYLSERFWNVVLCKTASFIYQISFFVTTTSNVYQSFLLYLPLICDTGVICLIRILFHM